MREPIVFTRAGLLRGFLAALPLSVSCVAFALVYGLIAGQNGVSVIETGLLSLIVFAGASQFLAVELWDQPLPVATLVGAVLVLNLRHLLMAPTLRRWLTAIPAGRAYASVAVMTDETWGLSLADLEKGGRDAAFLAGAGLCLYVFWFAGSILGRLFGGLVPDPERFGLDFLGTAFFIALLSGFWKGRGDILPWLAAGGTALAAQALIPGTWYIVIGALSGSLLGAWLKGRRHGG
ncbi:MAG TPA: AzlC family ABC transporter permease [Alphaproteobacteria bacterium]|nr:AzlC family ABC transporter permease [Alphaproteobacteria bacterium]